MTRRTWTVLAVLGLLGVLLIALLSQRGNAGSDNTGSRKRSLHFEVSIPYGGGSMPNTPTFDALAAADEDIASAVENAGLGEWEGQSVGAGTYDIGVLGDDQNAVLLTIKAVLARRGLAKGTVVVVTKNNAKSDPVTTVHF